MISSTSSQKSVSQRRRRKPRQRKSGQPQTPFPIERLLGWASSGQVPQRQDLLRERRIKQLRPTARKTAQRDRSITPQVHLNPTQPPCKWKPASRLTKCKSHISRGTGRPGTSTRQTLPMNSSDDQNDRSGHEGRIATTEVLPEKKSTDESVFTLPSSPPLPACEPVS